MICGRRGEKCEGEKSPVTISGIVADVLVASLLNTLLATEGDLDRTRLFEHAVRTEDKSRPREMH